MTSSSEEVDPWWECEARAGTPAKQNTSYQVSIALSISPADLQWDSTIQLKRALSRQWGMVGVWGAGG